MADSELVPELQPEPVAEPVASRVLDWLAALEPVELTVALELPVKVAEAVPELLRRAEALRLTELLTLALSRLLLLPLLLPE